MATQARAMAPVASSENLEMNSEPVKHEQREQDQFEFYIKWWTDALRELLRWSDDTISERVEMRRHSHSGMVLHELPAYWILPDVIPHPLLETLRKRDDGSLVHFGERLQDAIEDQQGVDWYRIKPHDWKACRERVNTILKEYGYQLPS